MNVQDEDGAERVDGGGGGGGGGGDEDGVSQREKGKFFRRPLPIPSMQSQRAVAERAVKRAKDALGTAMDDLGLTPPPVSRMCYINKAVSARYARYQYIRTSRYVLHELNPFQSCKLFSTLKSE